MASRAREITVPPSLSSGGLVRCNASRTAHVAGDAVGGLLLSAVPEELLHPFTGMRRRTHRTSSQSPDSATCSQAPSTRSPKQPRETPAQGGADGGGGVKVPRAEQSGGWRRQRGAGGGATGCGSAGPGGWRRWPRCSWVRGAGAGGAGAAGASFRYDAPRFPPCCVQLGFLQRAQFTASFCLDFLPAPL